MALDIHAIRKQLIRARILAGGEAAITPLSGGVSSDIHLIEEHDRRVVVKQARARLKVDQPWHADVARNLTEQRYIAYVYSVLPRAVPRLLYRSEQHNYFAMAYLDGYRDWKSGLMTGDANPEPARRAGSLIAAIHRRSWGDRALARRFDTTANFHALRTHPYLLTAAERQPVLKAQITAEAERLERTRLCLVHGDFSPKNIMVRQDRLVLIDCEAAWYGEPAFDLAFLFNHFLLKALYHRDREGAFTRLVPEAWTAYESRFGTLDRDFEERTARLLLMLMLARVDGKSPVEYLDSKPQKDAVRTFVHELLPQRVFRLQAICRLWRRHLRSTPAVTCA